jgi:serine/threonine protein kinase
MTCIASEFPLILVRFSHQLCEGQDLDAFIYRHKKKRQTLSETQIWRILTQIVMAVCACHAQNILHRDIKPHNSMYPFIGFLLPSLVPHELILTLSCACSLPHQGPRSQARRLWSGSHPGGRSCHR